MPRGKKKALVVPEGVDELSPEKSVVEATPEPPPAPESPPAPVRIRTPRPNYEDGPWIVHAGGSLPLKAGGTDALRGAKHALQDGARAVVIVSGDPAIVSEDHLAALQEILSAIASRR